MTVMATLERGSTTVSFPITDDAGTPLIARDIGKPKHDIIPTGEINPRSGQDRQSASETITIETRLYDTDLAIRLADLVKAHSGDDETILNIPLPEFDDNINVFPAAGQEQALTLEYVPGTKRIDVDLSLSRINSVDATSSDFNVPTPRSTGSGPITLSDESRTVAFSSGITVERNLGRPNVDVRSRLTDYPKVTDKRTSSYDAFSLTLKSVSSATSKVTDLRDMVRERRGRDTLTLSFAGQFGLGQFNVMPSGSAAVRWVQTAGRKNEEDMSVPQISLRVVQ